MSGMMMRKSWVWLAAWAVLMAGCGGSDVRRSDAEALTREVAVRFAEALVAGEYEQAGQLLSSEAQRDYSAAQLRNDYRAMVAYGSGPAKVDGVLQFMADWPAREARDIGWAYVSISGDDFAEAISVVVAEHDGQPVVRDIEWGRP
ncbi:hypothetical protein KEM63_13490 [Halopseudomonas nanhaiensis]|uniref:hypothetical protein n=1 Tax=Halopseudomonas nanhaiensis TaxID=2830842 RepID=UPI001CBAE27D|nr:hypothetical protein [Halopseudomonas nanhaiensis]UAW97799.1 hypothetical protein KEM63_13490 [Halopseudomonas nanhaiensis]